MLHPSIRITTGYEAALHGLTTIEVSCNLVERRFCVDNFLTVGDVEPLRIRILTITASAIQVQMNSRARKSWWCENLVDSGSSRR